MSSIPGTKVLSTVVPLDTADTYATHNPKYGKGGWRTVANAAERTGTLGTQLPMPRREEAMIVFQADNKHFYQLGADLITWTDLGTSLGGGSSLGIYEYDYNSDGTTLISNSFNFLNDTIGFGLNLPSAPSFGDVLYVIDTSGARSVEYQDVLLNRNGNLVNGNEDDIKFDLDRDILTFIFSSSGWVVF